MQCLQSIVSFLLSTLLVSQLQNFIFSCANQLQYEVKAMVVTIVRLSQ